MEELFIVIELQKNDDQLAHLITDYTDYSQAQFQFYYASAYAAISSIKNHTVLLMNDNGSIINTTTFYHPEPEDEGSEEPDDPETALGDPDNPGETEITPEPKILVIEYQINDDQAAKLVTTHDTIQSANSKFNTVVAYAATSNLKKHIIMMIDEVGVLIKSIAFEH